MIFDSQKDVAFAGETEFWTEWKKFIVKCKVEETEEVTSFYLEPQNEEELPDYISGQSTDIRVYFPEINNHITFTHSISCASNKIFFRISIKRNFKAENNCDNYLFDCINEGDILELTLPYGQFVLQNTNKNKVFISEDIGQTPLLAMIETLDLQDSLTEDIVWIHECKSAEFHAFKSKLKSISDNCENLKIFSFYKEKKSDVNNNDCYFIGELDINKIKAWKPDANAEYYICGSELFVDKQVVNLRDNSIKAEQIFVSKI